MEQYGKARRVGTAAICFAVCLRLFAAGSPMRVARHLAEPVKNTLLKYAETGRKTVRSFDIPAEPTVPQEETVPAIRIREKILPAETTAAPQETLPSFTGEESARIPVTDWGDFRPDLTALLQEPLSWELTGEEPTVLILHTHTTESYTKDGEDYPETVRFRTDDAEHNMVSIGDRVAELLEAGGIPVLHDREIHDYPSYNTAYSHARKAIRESLAGHPSIRLVLDLHRDAVETKQGQMRTYAQIDGQPSAQLMLVMGTGSGGKTNEYWLANLAVGVKLHALLERTYPGLMRPIDLRDQRFNQDLAPGILLVEVGSAGNTRAEALAAAEKLAWGILQLKHGSDAGK